MEAIYVNAVNDPNGNPRRGWIIQDRGLWKDFVDEGYEGIDALRREYPLLGVTAPLVALHIRPSLYRDLVKRFAKTAA